MTYSELVASVQAYTENTFPTADINRMIQIAEQTIYNTVQLASLRRNVTGSLSLGNKYLSCPADFLSTYSLAVIINAGQANEEYHYLLNKDVNFIREAYPGTGTAARGLPKHYAIFGPTYGNEAELSFIVGPTPDAAYGVELHYYFYPESIVTSDQTWLGDNFDSALFNGTMMEAIRYMKGEPDLVAMYQQQFLQSLTLLKNLGDGKQRMDAYRDGQVRNPVV
jgi:hypothetical protein